MIRASKKINRRRLFSHGSTGSPWYTLAKADGVDPSFWADFVNNRYAVNGVSVPFANVFTHTRASTATYFDASGVMQFAAVNTPRFDYDPVTREPLGLLMEEQRTNLGVNSNVFMGYNATVSGSQDNSLTALSDASRVTANAGLQYHRCGLFNTGGAGSIGTLTGTYTLSVYIKAGTVSEISIGFGVLHAYDAKFELSTGTVTYTRAGYTALLSNVGNGWYRAVLTTTFSETATYTTAWVLAGNITALGTEDFYIFGAQYEAGAFPTSYIPTTSTAVTRGQDLCVANTSNVIPTTVWTSAAEETVYAKATQFGIGNNAPRLLGESTGTNSQYASVSGSGVGLQYFNSGSAVATFNYTHSGLNSEVKIAIAAKVNDFAGSTNGKAVQTDTSGSFVQRTTLILGNGSSNNRNLNGRIKEFRCYPLRVSNAEINRLTVPDGALAGYYVIPIAGQSNSIGRYGPVDGTLDATNSRILQYGNNSGTLSVASDPLDHVDETANTVGFGISFAKALLPHIPANKGIILVPTGAGGKAVKTGYWQVGGTGYNNTVAKVNAAMNAASGELTLFGILWHQGESDAALSQATYEGYLDALIAGFRSSITGASSTTPFIVGEVPTWSTQYGAGVAAALAATPSRVSDTGYVTTSDLTDGGDSLHLSAASQRTLGDRYATKLLTLV